MKTKILCYGLRHGIMIIQRNMYSTRVSSGEVKVKERVMQRDLKFQNWEM